MPTILELFKGSPQDKQVKADKETFIEQETSGIRIKSLVELNNPLIYGNEAIRIVQRSTPLLETMKSNANGGEAGGGLLGGKINQARDFVNDKLGIPKGLIPSTIADKIIELRASKTPDNLETSKLESANSQTPITKDGYGPNGSLVGKFLKQSGGGNPKTIGKQALGSGIGVAKDKLRGALFGEGQNAGTAQSSGGLDGKTYSVEYTSNNRTYSDVNTSKTLITTKEELEDSKLDLSLVSPLYGVKRKGDDYGRFGKTKYGFKNTKNPGGSQNQYNPQLKDGKADSTYSFERGNTLEVKRGMFGKSGDKLILNPNKYESLELSTGKVKIGGKEYIDLVPLWIGYYGSSTPTLFRGTISGLTETVSPSWSSNNFVGNPYKFYTYESIERSTSFNISLYCNNPLELSANWERVSALTKMAYPSIQDNLSNPPFIWFKLGDIYNKKAGIIESLTYTIPDTTNWETEIDGFVLPKFIDVAITIKFIENVGDGSLSKLYNYAKSNEAVKKSNEEATKFSESTRINSDGSIDNDQKPLKLDGKSTPISEPSSSTSKAPKNLLTGKTDTTPLPKDDVSKDTTLSQSATADSFDGKPPTEKIKELESKQNLTPAQSTIVANLLLEGYENYTGPILGEHKDISNDNGLVMYALPMDAFGQRKVVRIRSNGNTAGPYYTSGL